MTTLTLLQGLRVQNKQDERQIQRKETKFLWTVKINREEN